MTGADGAPAGPAQLTAREAEVLRFLRLRLTNREIADRLVVSTRTVESHVSSLLAKLGKSSRRELAEVVDAVESSGRLPAPLDSFVGRTEELDAIAELLRVHRLVTVIGPPGVGKTRLAIETGRRVAADYGEGAALVELATTTDSDVADRLLLAVGGRQVPGQDALTTLATVARQESLLVVLDNCEHVSSAAAAAVQSLLASWPRTVVLATSREPLRVPGEVVRSIEPLTVPASADLDPARVLEAEAVRLLVDRAWASGAGLSVTDANATAVALLCRTLDGLPLAIELAAGRLRTLTPDQLSDRLDSSLSLIAETTPNKTRTLLGAIERSYTGLDADQRSLFNALAVFSGTFSLEAVETVCADLGLSRTVVDLFSALIDRSLVSVVAGGTTNRYRLLDTLHAYAREQLPADARERLLARHASYFVGLAEHVEPQLHGPAGPQALSALRVEHDNLSQALEWALVNEPELALRLVGALWQYWQDTDQRRSGIGWSERALATEVAGPPEVRLKAVLAAATLVAPWNAARCAELVAAATRLAEDLGDPYWWARTHLVEVESAAYTVDRTPEMQAAAERAAQVAIDYFRATGDTWRTAEVLNAFSLLRTGQAAVTMLAEARALYETHGDELRAGNCAYMTAAVLVRELDDPRAAKPVAEDALALAVRVGSEHETAHARSILAEVDLRDGARPLAVEVATECLDVFRRAADHRCVSAMLLLLGTAAAEQGENDVASAHLQEALEVARLGASATTVRLVHERLARLKAADSSDVHP